MNWLRTIRKQILELSQRALADGIDVDQSTLSRWETGESKISANAFQQLQDLVVDKTNRSLPAAWFFQNPNHEEVLSYFHTQTLSPSGSDVTGNHEQHFPIAELGASE